jgi:hypothetical protein
MPLVDLIAPPLTTIRIGHRDMGRGAALKRDEIRLSCRDSFYPLPRPALRGGRDERSSLWKDFHELLAGG